MKTRRLISASLLLGVCLALAAPLFALYAASHSATMSCCRRGTGACCHRSKFAGAQFAAGSECARQCSLAVAAPQLAGSLVSALLCLIVGAAFYFAVTKLELAVSRSTAYLAFLYQLPPPIASR